MATLTTQMVNASIILRPIHITHVNVRALTRVDVRYVNGPLGFGCTEFMARSYSMATRPDIPMRAKTAGLA